MRLGIAADHDLFSAHQGVEDDDMNVMCLSGLKDDQFLKGYQVNHFQPFDPVHKRTEATVKGTDGTEFKVTKRALQVILELSANAGQVKSVAVSGHPAAGLCDADPVGEDLVHSQVWRMMAAED